MSDNIDRWSPTSFGEFIGMKRCANGDYVAYEDHVKALRMNATHPAITHCDNCGCDWLDNGLNPAGCPYCKPNVQVNQSMMDSIVHSAVLRALDEASVKNDVLRGVCIEVALEEARDMLEEALSTKNVAIWQELEAFRKRHWTHWDAADNMLIAQLVQNMKLHDRSRPADKASD